MMIAEPARAKLNLALHVRARRADGYHELETLFTFVAIGDVVQVEPAETDRFAIIGPFADGLSAEDEDNLVLRALRGFRERFGTDQPMAITLDKRLPVASGIGGGSADAAATLRALARIAGVAPDHEALRAIAVQLGSDVPVCLVGRTAFGRGRGERLEPVTGAPGTPVLLVNPGVAVSTAAVFRAWDGVDRGSLADGPAIPVAQAGRNDLEMPARMLAPVIDEALILLRSGPAPLMARMSGSGATCFALFERSEDRAATAARVRRAKPGWWCVETELI